MVYGPWDHKESDVTEATENAHTASLVAPQLWAAPVAQLVKNLPAMWDTWVWSLGWEDPLEKGKLPPPVFWPGEFRGLYSPWDRKRVRHD